MKSDWNESTFDFVQRMPRRAWMMSGAALAAVLAVAAPDAAFAQDTQPEPAPATVREGGIEDIIVTARRREERAQETPVSITAISSDQLADLNIVRIDGLTQLAPSLRITQASGSGSAPAVYIRGIGTLSTALYVEPAVGVYLDGVYTPRPSGNTFDLPDVASVEVLRGPQGTLFGRNTTGGAILLATRNPEDEFGVQANFSYGSRNEITASSVVQVGQIGNSPFALKVSGQIHSRDGWVETPGVSASKWGGALYSYGLGAALRGELGGDFTVDLRGRYNKVNGKRSRGPRSARPISRAPLRPMVRLSPSVSVRATSAIATRVPRANRRSKPMAAC